MWSSLCHRFINHLQSCVLNTKKTDPGKVFLEDNYAPVTHQTRVENLEVRGKLPSYLHGTYIRNGPNPKHTLPKSYHWFDGDGMLHATFLDPEKNTAHYQNALVDTTRLHAPQYPVTIGSMTGIQGLFFILLDKLRPGHHQGGSANTSVVYYGGKVLALNEEDLPYEIGVTSDGKISTLGKMKSLPISAMTAHPKIDPHTNELYYINYSLFEPFVAVGCFNEDYEQVWHEEVELQQPVMMHDFAITENYVILLDNPLTFDPNKMVDGENSPIQLDTTRLSRIGVIPKKAPIDMTRWFDLPSAFGCFHVVHAFEHNDRIMLYLCQYDSIDILFMKTASRLPQVVEHVIDLKTGKTYSTPIPMTQGSEFPAINPHKLGRKARYAWVALIRDGITPSHFYGIAKMDLEEGYVTRKIEYPVQCYGGEPLFVPRPDGETEDDGVLLVYTYHERKKLSQLRVYDAKTMNYEPVAVIDIPHRIPYGFHGCFVPKI